MNFIQAQRRCNKSTTKRSSGRRAFSGKCAALVKEQRARIYILRRCATMLLCWFCKLNGFKDSYSGNLNWKVTVTIGVENLQPHYPMLSIIVQQIMSSLV